MSVRQDLEGACVLQSSHPPLSQIIYNRNDRQKYKNSGKRQRGNKAHMLKSHRPYNSPDKEQANQRSQQPELVHVCRNRYTL